MKKIYIPTEEELSRMHELNANVYKYVLVKVIEVLTSEVALQSNGVDKKAVYEYFSDHPEVISAICRMYPEEIRHSIYAENDIDLCRSLIKNNPDQSIYLLDNLSYFENGVGVCTNNGVIADTVEILHEKLPATPKYRFEYKEPNSLLDDIFTCQLPLYLITGRIVDGLISIDPVYALKADENIFTKHVQNFGKSSSLQSTLCRKVEEYGRRYGLKSSDYADCYGVDVLDKKNEKSRKLVRCLQDYLKKHK